MKGENPMTRNSDQNNVAFKKTLAELIALEPTGENSADRHPLPSWSETAALLEDLRVLLLMDLTPADVEQKLARATKALTAQLKTCLPPNDNDASATALSDAFLTRLPDIRRDLQADTEIALQSDPAVTLRAEITLCYPGLKALAYYRIARALYRLEVPILPRLITEIAHSITGIDIHPGAQIGKRFFIDHGTGVVIGATCIIGSDVKVYQGVTLGALSFPRSEEGHIIKGQNRHPIIGDRVTIYSGATILGRITIGSDSVIGGNVWVTKDVPAMSNVMQQRSRQDCYAGGGGI